MKLKISPVGEEPITLQQAKDWLQVDYDNDDGLISRLIRAARQYVETICGVSIIEKEIELQIQGYDTPYLLPYGPVKEITLLEIDGVDELANVFAMDYVNTAGTQLTAEYVAGYDELPEGLEQLIYDILKIYYDARSSAAPIPDMVKQGLQLYTRNLFL
jgi:hypothetical protein